MRMMLIIITALRSCLFLSLSAPVLGLADNGAAERGAEGVVGPGMLLKWLLCPLECYSEFSRGDQKCEEKLKDNAKSKHRKSRACSVTLFGLASL